MLIMWTEITVFQINFSLLHGQNFVYGVTKVFSNSFNCTKADYIFGEGAILIIPQVVLEKYVFETSIKPSNVQLAHRSISFRSN